MALIRWLGNEDPRAEFGRITRELNRLMAAFDPWVGQGQFLQQSGVYPPLNLYDDGESLIARAEVPGIEPADLDITVTRDTLTIRGERKSTAPENVAYHRREREAGSFHRTVNLPEEVNSEKVVAACHNGVLEVRMPRAEHARPRKVTVG